MLTVSLRRFVSAHQRQFVPLLIAIGAGSLSLFLTVRACRVWSPADSALVVVALGALCEVAKLSFGPRALLGFLHAAHLGERVGYLALGVLVLVLMAASVGASFVFTSLTEAQVHSASLNARAQALAASDEYQALTADIDTHAARIAAFLDERRRLREAGMLTKADEKDKLLLAAQAAKDASVVRRAGLYAAALPSDEASSEVVRWIHLEVAVVLELVGIAACVLVHTSRPSAAATAAALGGAASLSVDGGTGVLIGAARHKPKAIVPKRGGLRSVGADLAERCAEARRLIAAGQLDPSQEALARSFRISQRPATRLLKELRDEGIIRWAGNRYLVLMSTARFAS